MPECLQQERIETAVRTFDDQLNGGVVRQGNSKPDRTTQRVIGIGQGDNAGG
jgi:hypothetical protein